MFTDICFACDSNDRALVSPGGDRSLPHVSSIVQFRLEVPSEKASGS